MPLSDTANLAHSGRVKVSPKSTICCDGRKQCSRTAHDGIFHSDIASAIARRLQNLINKMDDDASLAKR